MIVTALSAAQLDTIDADEIGVAVGLARGLDKLEEMTGVLQRTGIAIASMGRAFALILDCNAPRGDRATLDRHTEALQRLTLEAPRFIDPPRFDLGYPRANPRAPIPERLRRRMDRGRDRR